MLTLPNCEVTTEDEIHPPKEHAHVVIIGESPNCTARFAEPDYVHHKFEPIDRLTSASFTRTGDTWAVTGRSDYMADVIGADDPIITITATPAPGCAECRK